MTNSEKFKPPVTDSAQDGGVQMSIEEQTPVATEKNVAELTRSEKQDAAMGIRTPVVGVRALHDWPVYTIAAFKPPAAHGGLKELGSLPSTAPSTLAVTFERADLDLYVESACRDVVKQTANRIRQIAGIIWEQTQGIISDDRLRALHDYFIQTYCCDSESEKCFIYTRAFMNSLHKTRLYPRRLSYLTMFEQPKTQTHKMALLKPSSRGSAPSEGKDL